MKTRDGGFSLLEALIALVVLSVSAQALLTATETHTRRVGDVMDRRIALWVAENQLAALRLGAPEPPVAVQMARAEWRVKVSTRATDDPNLLRADILVSTQTVPNAPLAQLTSYISASQSLP